MGNSSSSPQNESNIGTGMGYQTRIDTELDTIDYRKKAVSDKVGSTGGSKVGTDMGYMKGPEKAVSDKVGYIGGYKGAIDKVSYIGGYKVGTDMGYTRGPGNTMADEILDTIGGYTAKVGHMRERIPERGPRGFSKGPTEHKMKLTEMMKKVNIHGEKDLNDAAIVLAEHCPTDTRFPGRVARFNKGTKEVSLSDIEQSIGNDTISLVFVNEGVSADFYEQPGFTGRSFSVKGPEIIECLAGSYEGGAFNDIISSIRLSYSSPSLETKVASSDSTMETPGVEKASADTYEAFEGRIDRIRPGLSKLPTAHQMKVTKVLEKVSIHGEKDLNGAAVVLAEHCPRDSRWPGRVARFNKGTKEVSLQDIEKSIGNDTLSFVFVNEGVIADFYEHAGFQGRSFQVHGPKVVECLAGGGPGGDINDIVSSIRLTYPGTPDPPAATPVDPPAAPPATSVCEPTQEELEKMRAAIQAKNSGEFADAYEAYVGRVKQEEGCKSFFDALRPVISLFGNPPDVKFVEDTPAVYQRVSTLTEELLKASDVVDSNPVCAPTSTELTTMQAAITAKDPDAFSTAFFSFSQRISGLETECDFRTVVKPVQDLFPSTEALNTFIMSSNSSEQKLKESSEPIRPVIGTFLLAPESNPLTDLPDMKQVFMESQMNPADGFLPYTPDSYDEDATQFNVTHNGKRYKVQTNSYSPGNHAVTLFIDPKNNPGLTFWAAQIQKANKSFYYKGYEGKMVVGEGDWVEIEYPDAQVINTYTLHFNLMTTAGNFVEVLDVPPTGWVVLGSNDGVKWDVLHESNVGKSGWMKSEWSDFSDIRDGAITQTIGSNEPYTHFRLLVTRWGDDLLRGDTSTLRRLDRWVLGTGAATNAPEVESDDSDAPSSPPSPPPPPPPPPSTTEKAFSFLKENKMYVIGGAVLIVAFLVYFFMFR